MSIQTGHIKIAPSLPVNSSVISKHAAKIVIMALPRQKYCPRVIDRSILTIPPDPKRDP
jgi:hypothetical protein